MLFAGMYHVDASCAEGTDYMKLPLIGGCVCGSVRYEISQNPTRIYACHCTDCQRATTSAFSIGGSSSRRGVSVDGKRITVGSWRRYRWRTRQDPLGLPRLWDMPLRRHKSWNGATGLRAHRSRRHARRYVVVEADHTLLYAEQAAMGDFAGRRDDLRGRSKSVKEHL